MYYICEPYKAFVGYNRTTNLFKIYNHIEIEQTVFKKQITSHRHIV